VTSTTTLPAPSNSTNVEGTASVTWEELVEREPRLQQLLDEIEAIDPKVSDSFCGDQRWYGMDEEFTYVLQDPGPLGHVIATVLENPTYAEPHYRPIRGYRGQMSYLVGWYADRDDPILGTTKAYDCAFDKLYWALPDCRNCQRCNPWIPEEQFPIDSPPDCPKCGASMCIRNGHCFWVCDTCRYDETEPDGILERLRFRYEWLRSWFILGWRILSLR
jgi:hypothetical protein